jgi:hypothetical protein
MFDKGELYDAETAKEISNTILQQMGGTARIKAFVNGKNFIYSRDGTTTFQFSLSKKANAIKIRLNGNDLYDVEFVKVGSKSEKIEGTDLKFRTGTRKTVSEYTDIGCEQLVELFELETGLYLHF